MKLAALIFALLTTMSASADSFTDGIRKRVADGQIEIKMSDSPMMDDIFDRTYEQRKEGVIDYIASLFRKHMTEKEFNSWMTYQPSQDEVDYENRLKSMQDEVRNGQTTNWSTDSILALLTAGKEVEMVKAKPCTENFKKAYDHYVTVNGLNLVYDAKKAMNGAMQLASDQDMDALTKKAFEIWENNMKNSMLNSYIDHSTEKQLKEFSRELKFDKPIREISIDYMDLMKLFEAAFGINVNQLQDIIDKKKDNLVNKYGHQTVDFSVGVNGLKRVYDKF